MVHSEYQVTQLNELFDIETLARSLKQLGDSRELSDTGGALTPQETAVLNFIVDNPTVDFIELQNTFTMSDVLVVELVLEYGTKSEDYEELRELKQKIRDEK